MTWFDLLFATTPAGYVAEIAAQVPQQKTRFACFICAVGGGEQTYYRPGFEKRI